MMQEHGFARIIKDQSFRVIGNYLESAENNPDQSA